VLTARVGHRDDPSATHSGDAASRGECGLATRIGLTVRGVRNALHVLLYVLEEAGYIQRVPHTLQTQHRYPRGKWPRDDDRRGPRVLAVATRVRPVGTPSPGGRQREWLRAFTWRAAERMAARVHLARGSELGAAPGLLRRQRFHFHLQLTDRVRGARKTLLELGLADPDAASPLG